MKYSKILRALAVAVILSLLVIAIPAAPALAAEEIEISPDNGEVGIRLRSPVMALKPMGQEYGYISLAMKQMKGTRLMRRLASMTW